MTLLRNLRNRQPRASTPNPAQTPTEAREERRAALLPSPAPTAPRARTRPARPASGTEIPESILIPTLMALDREPERVREGGANAIHVAGLLNECHRMLQLAKRTQVPLYQGRPTGGHRIMWVIGKAIEHHIRSTMITALRGENVRGRWSCPCEETIITADVRPNDPCPACGLLPHIYKELILSDDEYGVRGSPDLVLLRPEGYVVVEIKSKKADGDDGFDALEEPEGPHVEQAAIYRRLLQRSGLRVAPYVVIIYCTKDFRWGNPYKEYPIAITPDDYWDRAVDHHMERAQMIRSGELLPRLGVCTKPDRPKPKECPTCVDCFSRAT